MQLFVNAFFALLFQSGKGEMTGCECSLKLTCCHCSAQLPVTVSFLLCLVFAVISFTLLTFVVEQSSGGAFSLQ